MKDEKHDTAPRVDGDGALYEYLDDMLHDSAAGKPTSVTKPIVKLAATSKRLDDRVRPLDNVRLLNPERAQPLHNQAVSSGIKSVNKTTSKDHVAAGLQRSSWLSPVLLEKSATDAEIEKGSCTDATLLQGADAEQDRENRTQSEIDAEALDAQVWCENGRPLWAQQNFECLIFSVNGLKLAVPLITLGSIQPLDRKLTSLPGQPDWFMGMLPTASMGNLKVLDTALCVMPERYRPEARDSLRYVITIHGCEWGLACDSVEKSITLDPDKVKWRTQRGKRPWLAGTVVEYMCSLVDTDGFQRFLI